MKESSSYRIFIAEGGGPWRTGVVSLLEEDQHEVLVTGDGREALAMLEGRQGSADLMIVGDHLEHLGGFDALFLACRGHEEVNRRREDWPVSSLLLVTSVRRDYELLNLVRSRGVTGFVYRDDPFERTLNEVSSCLFAPVRRERRVSVRLPGALVRGKEGDESTPVTIVDLTSAGAMLWARPTNVKQLLAKGERVSLRLSAEVGTMTGEDIAVGVARVRTVAVEVAAEVRWTDLRKRLLGDRVVVGVKFLQVDESSRAALELILRHHS